jgi:DNA/RNA endonuclease G (NUC1)
MSMTTRVLLLCAMAALCSASIGFDNCSHLFVEKSYKMHKPRSAIELCREGHLAIAYDTLMVNPAWSAYYVTPADVASNIHGRDSFYEDPDLRKLNVQQASTHSHAFNESWNKGHCAPSRIMSSSKASKKSCYTMANVAPQSGHFNQHAWEELERSVFDWIAANNTALHVVTGVMYEDRSNPARSWDNIAVPDYYFKIVCDKKHKTSVGFYGENKPRSKSERDRTMWVMRSVKEVEEKFGGVLLPTTECKTDSVDASHWWYHQV